MNTLTKIEHWADSHHPNWIDIIRIALGLTILFKGIFFTRNIGDLLQLMERTDLLFVSLGVAHYIAFAHLVGGILIAMGLVTRFAIIFQLPILLLAVFLVNVKQGFFTVSNNLEFELSLVVLILLVVFLIYGSGKWSVDNWMKNHPNE